jgi:AGZA family xanthine/uracil permease-like MFS transporter
VLDRYFGFTQRRARLGGHRRLLLACSLLRPIAGIVPPEATAPALVMVGYLMTAIVREIPFADLEEGFPALLTFTVMPFTYSITNGIGAGFVTYCLIKMCADAPAKCTP